MNKLKKKTFLFSELSHNKIDVIEDFAMLNAKLGIL